MKKIILFLVIIFNFLVTKQTAAQDTWQDFLENTIWQEQNPPNSMIRRMIGFSIGGNLNFLAANMSTGQQISKRMEYSISINKLVITDGDNEVTYKLTFINQNKITMFCENDNVKTILARSGSVEDRFAVNPNAYLNPGYGNYNGGGYNSGGSSNSTYTTCYTCQGTGSCKVCGGTGTYSAYGYSSTCKACSGTGKCWHCQGSGKQ